MRKDLADVANAIAAFEPVTMLVRPDEVKIARPMLHDGVTVLPMAIDDLWVRDTGPVIVTKGGVQAGVGFNFNGWGGKQAHAADARVAASVAEDAKVELLATKLTLEGGALEVDGLGTAIVTESCVLNDNRNPGWTKPQVEAELGRLLGITNVIWLPGVKGKDITDGHTDFYARFTAPGRVVATLDNDPQAFDYKVTRAHLEILKSATDPQFGDATADAAARDTLVKLLPDRQVVQVDVDGIAAGGGGIHCSTQQQPR